MLREERERWAVIPAVVPCLEHPSMKAASVDKVG